MKQLLVCIALLSLGISSVTSQCLLHSSSALSQPISVMGAHMHPKGELMFSYNLSYMDMNGMQEGNVPLAQDEVLNRYMMYSSKMKMPMHMVMGMYAISDKVNVMVMTHYMSCSMDMLHQMGTMSHEMNSTVRGWGDTRITGLFKVFGNETTSIIAQGGLSLPTGSIENRDDMGMNPHRNLGYAMQFGSGTVDLIGSIAHTKTSPVFSYGLQSGFIIRNGVNEQNYHLGNQYYATVWAGRTLFNRLFLGVKTNGTIYQTVDGMDTDMDMMSSTGDPKNTGYERVNGSVYLAWQPLKDENITLHVEYETPLIDEVTGVQMSLDKVIYAGLKLGF